MSDENNVEPNNPVVDKTTMYTPAGIVNPHHAHVGPILAVLVIMLVLILGGLYLWGGALSTEVPVTPEPIVNNEPETPRADADTQILETLSPSDDLSAIEADINSTSFDSLDTDFTAIESELDSASTQ